MSSFKGFCQTDRFGQRRMAGSLVLFALLLGAMLAAVPAHAQAPVEPGKPPQIDTQPEDRRAEAEQAPRQDQQSPMEGEEEEEEGEEGGPSGQGCPYMGNKLELTV